MRRMIKEITNKKEWEDFLVLCEEKTFLHSWNWGDFQKSLGEKIWRLGFYEKENQSKLTAVALLIVVRARRGNFLLCPHGPVTILKAKEGRNQIIADLLQYSKKIAEQEKVNFIRVCPIWQRNEDNIAIFKNIGFRQAPIHVHPELSWELDISKREEELLSEMRKTTRYLIKKGLKNQDITIELSRDIKSVEDFNKLYQATVQRHHFVPFSLDYLKKEFKAFEGDDQILVFLGKYKGEVISSAMIIFWQDMAFYHQGASSQKYAKIPSSYLLQWEAIKEAKKRGAKVYNFWGIAPEGRKNHPWKGITLFKKGFGGYSRKYLKTYDFIISPKYWFSYIIERFRSKKRGF